MANRESTVAIFWVLVGFAICLESFYLKMGRISSPGPGFFPFVAGGMIGLLGLILLFLSFLTRKGKEGKKETQAGFRFHPLVMIFLTLLSYSVFLNWLGYLISTLILMLFLFSIGGKKGRWWFWLNVGKALLVTLASYLIFGVLLQCSLPKGILKEIFRI